MTFLPGFLLGLVLGFSVFNIGHVDPQDWEVTQDRCKPHYGLMRLNDITREKSQITYKASCNDGTKLEWTIDRGPK
jgi:hypothetical protein